ncbi:MAG TPA: hypothetical protein VF603_02670 [Allosphingosinicella sp.]|jgi:hypothetical protein
MTIVPRIRFLTMAVASIALAGSLAPAQAAPAAARTGAAVRGQNQSPASSERRICVSADLTGSRIMRRICRTAAEWQRAGGIPTND